jgi:peptidoglycan/LPS O-acetylase OafA/YrhL
MTKERPAAERPVNRLLPIEGLRAYLALWVLVNHVIFFSTLAFQDPLPDGDWRAQVRRLESGPLAVQVFMIISGFVIFMLLDKRRETYAQFITRRFFRLYPIYVLLLVVSVAAGAWRWETFVRLRQYMDPDAVAYFVRLTQATSNHWGSSLALHLVMLQGLPHGAWLDGMTAYSFIISAWSISVEWEFYLLAPLIYFLLQSRAPLHRIGAWIGALFLFLAARHFGYFTPNLLVYLPFFLLGVASYFGYKALPATPANTMLPAALVLTVCFFLFCGHEQTLIPLLIWIPFWGLLCEPADSVSARVAGVLFNNPVAQFLGTCSYGIYLCHELAVLVAQTVLLHVAPDLGPSGYFIALLALTLAGAILLAALLHYLVERPGMELGRKLAAKMPGRRPAVASTK